MDGITLLTQLRNRLNEEENSTFLDAKSSYDFINEGAIEFAQKTKIITAEQSITTVASQSEYELNANYLNLYLKDDDFKFYIKYSDGTNLSFPEQTDYQKVSKKQVVIESLIPNRFYIRHSTSTPTRLTGTATATGTLSGGETTLTDTGADFITVSVGDSIHNTTDAASGVVLSKTSATVITVAMFGGTNDNFTSGDAYVIQPQNKMVIGLEDVPSTSGHTFTVSYVKRPDPVYSSYASYPFPQQYTSALVMYAMYLYKVKDRDINTASKFLTIFDRAVRLAGVQNNQSFGTRRINLNLKARPR